MSFKVDFSSLDWGEGQEGKLRGRPDTMAEVEHHIESMAAKLESRARVSSSGKPYVAITRGSVGYCLSYRSDGTWSAFYPFPSWGADTKHLDFANSGEVIEYFGR